MSACGDVAETLWASPGSAPVVSTGRKVQALRAVGKTAEEIIRDDKPEIIAATPAWEHPDLLDWEINYFAAQPS